MHLKTTFIYLLAALMISGCKSNAKSSPTEGIGSPTPPPLNYEPPTPTPEYEEPVTAEAQYEDGVYCALVKYYNPSSGSSNYYKLTVEVENGELVKMWWPNGGWLDNSHFTPPDVDDSGHCTFTSDKGYQFELFIDGEGQCITSDNFNDDEDAEETLIEKYGDKKATVYKRFSGCDYMILECRGDYIVAEWMGGRDPDEGDIIQGNLTSYGTKTCYVINRDRETRLWIDDYMLSLSSAYEKIKDHCNLDE
jgi:hypothetical protein